jgi:membrane-associated protein
LGGFAFVRNNIELMLVGVVVLSLIPLAVEFIKARRERRAEIEYKRETTELG